MKSSRYNPLKYLLGRVERIISYYMKLDIIKDIVYFLSSNITLENSDEEPVLYSIDQIKALYYLDKKSAKSEHNKCTGYLFSELQLFNDHA